MTISPEFEEFEENQSQQNDLVNYEKPKKSTKGTDSKILNANEALVQQNSKQAAVYDINLPNAPPSDSHVLNVGNRRPSSNVGQNSSASVNAASNASSKKIKSNY